MPRRDSAPLGAPCWIDLFTSDAEAARSFYGDLFGWTSVVGGEEYGGYISFERDGTMVAGAMTNDGSSGAPDAWTVYLATADAQATVDAAAAHGGQLVMGPMEVPEMGHMAVLTEPGGAAFGIWQPTGHQGFGVLAEPGSPGWFELHTRSYKESVAFHEEVFGWDTHVASDTEDFRYTTMGEEEAALAGIMDDTVMGPDGPPAYWATYFQVADTDAALARIVELGGAKVMGPDDTPYGRLAVAADPTGARFHLVG